MPTPPADDRDTLQALEQLSAAPRVAAPPTLRKAGPTALPPEPKPTALTETTYRCLKCGYRLLLDSELRCSECGRQHTADEIDAWYSGAERRRLELVIWLVAVGLFLRLWPLPQMIGLIWLPALLLAPVAAAILCGWACIIACNRRFDSLAGRYAVAGVVTAGLQLLWATRELWREEYLASPSSTMGAVMLDLMLAWLLLAVVSRPADDTDIWGAARGRWIAWFGLLATPVFAVSYSVVLEVFSRVGTLAAGAGLSTVLSILSINLFSHLVPWAILLAVWTFEWRWFAGLRRALFAPRER